MKNKLFGLFVMLMLGGANSFAEMVPVDLSVGYDEPYVPGQSGHGKSPILPPSIWQDGYQIGFLSEHAEYTIELVQEGTVVYSTLVSESTSSIMLPSWLEGEYELHLIPADSSYYFFGYISF